jgi:membrane protein
MFGPATAQILMGAVRSSQHTKGGLSTVVSVITLLIGATTVFAALEDALEQIWNTRSIKRAGVRGWIRTRLLSLGFILALGFLLLVSLTVSTLLAAARQLLAHRYAGVVAILGALDPRHYARFGHRNLRAHLSVDAGGTVAMGCGHRRRPAHGGAL